MLPPKKARPVTVCTPARRTEVLARDDLQPSSRSLALPGARAGSVMVSLNLESRVLAKHKMGPAFSHFGRLRRGLSFCFCRIPPCIFVPCTWRFSDPPDPGMSFAPGTYPRALAFMRRRQMTRVRDGPCRGTQNPGKFPEYSRCILDDDNLGRERDKTRQTAAAKHDTSTQHRSCRSS